MQSRCSACAVECSASRRPVAKCVETQSAYFFRVNACSLLSEGKVTGLHVRDAGVLCTSVLWLVCSAQTSARLNLTGHLRVSGYSCELTAVNSKKAKAVIQL